MTVAPVSVVIASRNRPTLLRDAVQSILAGSDAPAEIVIVDQSDRAAPMDIDGGACRIRHISVPPRGLSAARNLGAAMATHELVAFADDDVLADREWLAAMRLALAHADPFDAVTGRVLTGPPESPAAFVPAVVEGAERNVFRGRLRCDVLAGGNMALRRDTFLRLGGFDTRLGPGSRFPAAEDNDLGFRILENGGAIVYEPLATVYHRAWRPRAAYLPLRFAYGRGKGGFYAKYFGWRDRHIARRAIADLLGRPFRAARFWSHPRHAIGELAYAAGIVRGLLEWTLLSASTVMEQPDVSAIAANSSTRS